MVKPITDPAIGTTTIELSEADKKILAKSRDIWLQISHYESAAPGSNDGPPAYGAILIAAQTSNLLRRHAIVNNPGVADPGPLTDESGDDEATA